MKVLVIDDSKFQCLALRRVLGRAGHEVIIAGDGEEGLRAARETRPELILLDMLLPKLSGIDVLRRLKEKPDDGPPVIVLTGLSEKNSEKLIEAGASGFFQKSAAFLDGNCHRLVSLVAQISRQKRVNGASQQVAN